MEIIVFRQHFKLPSQAGSTRMFKFSKELSSRGHKVTIITGSACRLGALKFGKVLRSHSPISKEFYIDSNIKVISLLDFYNQKLNFYFRILSFIIFSIFSSILSLKEKKADIVFASSTPLTIGIPAILYSKIYKRPFVFEIRDLWPEAAIQLGVLRNRMLIQLATWLELFCYRKASFLIGLSQGICKKIQTRSGKPCLFIPNSVDDEFFERRTAKIECNDKAPVKVVYAGSCGYNNAIEVLFEVAQRTAGDPDLSDLIQFQIIGDGPALKQLKDGVPKNLSLLGRRSKSDTIDLLIKADIAFFSQRKLEKGDLKKDSLGNKYFDFLGAALPIVAGIVRGGEMTVDIEKHGCGIVVEPEDVNSLCNAVKRLASSKQLRLQMSNAAAELSKNYVGSKIAGQFASVLEQTPS